MSIIVKNGEKIGTENLEPETNAKEFEPSGLTDEEKKEKTELEKKYENRELDTGKIARLRHLKREAGEGDFEEDPWDYIKYGEEQKKGGVDRRHREGPKGGILGE